MRNTVPLRWKKKKRNNEKKKEDRAVARDSFGFLSRSASLARDQIDAFAFHRIFIPHSFLLLLYHPLPPPSLFLSSVHRRPFCRPVFAATRSTGVEGDPRLFEYTRYAKCAKWRTRVLHLLKAISAKPPTKPFLLCHGSPLSLSLSRSISMRLSSNPLLGSLG